MMGAAYTADRDHPRVGGEKKSNQNVIYDGEGSPPRGRGKGNVCF